MTLCHRQFCWLAFILLVSTGCNNGVPFQDAGDCVPRDRVIKVFRGAQGFGTETVAGRGGQIVRVSNLEDSGRGSLREALSQQGPAVVVFEVGGTIELKSSLKLRNPYFTIAGQTAPDPGIMLKGGGINVNTHDVLIQHLVIRPGQAADYFDDGVAVNSSSGWNVVLDHLSLQWANDEQISTWIGAHDITVSNSLIAEGLRERHGMLIGDAVHNVSVIGNLFAHNGDRNPAQKGDTSAVIINNLVYNPGGSEHYYFSDNGYADKDGDGFSGPLKAAVVGNVFIDGNSSRKTYTAVGVAKVHPSSQVYQANNQRRHGVVFKDSLPPVATASSPLDLSPYDIEANLRKVEKNVLSKAGSRPGRRDAVDQRIVTDVRQGTGQVPEIQPVYPEYAATARPFIPPVNPSGDDDCDGYTNLEELLHRLSDDVVK